MGGHAVQGFGPWTGHRLDELSALCAPWVSGNGGRLPPFSQSAARLSLELSALAYEKDGEPWAQAGWRDISCRAEKAGENPERAAEAAVPGRLRRLLRQAPRLKNRFVRLQESMRMKRKRTSEKQVFLAHPLGNGRFLIAIGFMGTAHQLSDWQVNLKINRASGAHQGFWEMARALEEREEEITFPETARALGLKRLSLRDMIAECTAPGSRFTFWLSGHSQGGAVLQLYAWSLFKRGFLRQYLVGYGFASPSVFYEGDESTLSAYPIYHIINGDDAVARMGARIHVGMCRVLNPDQAMRQRCYGALEKDDLFRRVLALVSRLRTSAEMLLFLSSLLKALKDLPDDEILAVLSGVFSRYVPGKLSGLLGGSIDEMLGGLKARLDRSVAQALGPSPFPPEKETLYALYLSRIIRQAGARPFARALAQVLSVPHKLRTKAGYPGQAPYEYIVMRRFGELRQSLFGGSAPLRYAARPRPSPRRKKTRFAAYTGRRGRGRRHETT